MTRNARRANTKAAIKRKCQTQTRGAAQRARKSMQGKNRHGLVKAWFSKDELSNFFTKPTEEQVILVELKPKSDIL